ncbi:hypothetical protein PF010_g27464 [Phytophthora fragariae]|uniref:CNNM transmembrane domain-containing protein n=1 Tax=Phytophthora fragariae TaxID=53985 RepID=A0A6G0JUC1_9STRA|nr:hypothetical protein PF010_g27464 [Phytophthora fragariae]
MTSMLFRAASATLVARRITDVAHQEASADADTIATAGSGSDSGVSDVMKAIHYGAIVLLIVMSAISSGLTLGLMSLDKVSLDVIIRAGDRPGATKDEMRKAKAARRILPVRADSNLLLTTLVLTTVAVNSLLSILMADLTSGLVGFFVSTILILICGEIIPQSLCSRHALSIGSALVPVVRVLRLLLYIFAKPVSFVLDKTVGEDVGTIFTKRELQKLVEIHVRQKIMHPEEGYIVRGAMSYKRKAVSDIMIPAEKLFSLPISFTTLRFVGHAGDPFYELKGLVTLEDIVEEILQSKIIDETDSPEARKERQNCTDQIGYSDGGEFVAHTIVLLPPTNSRRDSL